MKKNILVSAIVASLIVGSSALMAADLNVAGSVNVTANPIPIGTTRTGYPALNMGAADDASIAWTLGTGVEADSPSLNAVGFINPVSGSGPFFILNDAVSDLLLLSQDSVVVNGDDLDTPFGTSNLIVGGDMLAIHDGSGTENVYRLLTLSANDTDGTGPSEAAFVLNNAKAGKEWLFRTIDDGKAFTATLGGTGGAEFKVSSPTGNYRDTELYLGNGAKNVGGVWYNASSRTLKENIKPLSTKDALTAFSKLQPLTYNYKTDKSEKVVGFIAEDVPALVAIV